MTTQATEKNKVTPVKRIGAREARNQFSDLVGSVHYSGEPVVVERSGKPMVAIIPFELYEQIETTLKLTYSTTNASQASSLNELRALFKATQALPVAQSISEAEIAAEIAAYRSSQL